MIGGAGATADRKPSKFYSANELKDNLESIDKIYKNLMKSNIKGILESFDKSNNSLIQYLSNKTIKSKSSIKIIDDDIIDFVRLFEIINFCKIYLEHNEAIIDRIKRFARILHHCTFKTPILN